MGFRVGGVQGLGFEGDLGFRALGVRVWGGFGDTDLGRCLGSCVAVVKCTYYKVHGT